MTSESQNPPSNLKKIDSIAELKNFFLKRKRKVPKIIPTLIIFSVTL